MCCIVDPDEEAVAQLVNHFNSVIDSLLAKSWKHYPIRSERKGPGPLMFDPTKMEKKFFQKTPTSFMLQPSTLSHRLLHYRATIVRSFRDFKFETYNPVISRIFDATFVADTGSGIDALFPPRHVGRPKRLRLSAKTESKHSATSPLLDIVGQATDAATKEVYVLVHWLNARSKEAMWIPTSNLTDVTQNWWLSELEKRFPWIDLAKETVLRISGGPVTLIDDDSSDAHVLSPPETG